LRDTLLKGIEMKTLLVESLLDRDGWDLFAAVFAESHCAGHQFWHLHDPAHPRHDPAEARAIGDPLRDIYAALDAAIGRLLTRAGDETAVFVLASHGMGAHYDATFLLDEILRRLYRPAATASERAVARGAESAWRFLPAGLRRALRPLRGRVRASLANAVSHPELASLPCFSVPNNDVYGGIRVNLAGREPQGRIRPGAEYDAFCDTLTSDLLAFVNLETGRPLVRRVLRSSEVYEGERLQDLPDLMVEWDRDSPVSAISSPKTGTIRGKFPGIRTGDHKPEGMVFAMGPGIRPGRLPRPISITEFAPTIAARLGVRLTNVDAAPVPELAGSGSPAGVVVP
jgi:predicted AlkP superfamily phosphohydrolase/phosphomutase